MDLRFTVKVNFLVKYLSLLYCVLHENTLPSFIQLTVKLYVIRGVAALLLLDVKSCCLESDICRIEGHELIVEQMSVTRSFSITEADSLKVMGQGLSGNNNNSKEIN